MPTPLPRCTMDFPLPMLSPLDMPTTLDMLPTLLTLPLSIPTGDTSEDTTDTVDCLDTVARTHTTLARGRLTLMLMPTPLPRCTMDFPLPMLLPLDMPTTLDMLPTLLTLPLSIGILEDILDTLDSTDWLVSTIIKQHKVINQNV